MLPGYQKLGLLVFTSFLLVIVAEAYSDVDLRIAERRAIPHYIRHSYEYPDIDIKSIMIQRGLLPGPTTASRTTFYNNPVTTVTQEPWLWIPRNTRKYLKHSNYLEPSHQHHSRWQKKYTRRWNKHGSMKTKKYAYDAYT